MRFRSDWFKGMMFFVGIFFSFLVLSTSLYGDSDPKVIEAAKGESALTLWTTSDLRQVTKLAKGFEKKYPFLKVKLFRTGTVPLHNKTRKRNGNNGPDIYGRSI